MSSLRCMMLLLVNMSKGILLIAYGKYYGQFAYNLAASIKSQSDVKIHLVCDEAAIKNLQMDFFDSHKIYDFPMSEGRIDPCQTKIEVLKMSPFEKTMYLDVDAVCLNKIDPLFDALDGEPVYVHIMGQGGEKDKIHYSHWADNDVIWPHFKLSHDAVLPSTQTSIIYFEKGSKSKSFFAQLQKNYNNKLDKKQYTNMWGLSKSHPDELYFAVTFAHMGNIPKPELKPIFYPVVLENEGKILKDYYLLSIYGAHRTIKNYALSLYDRVMKKLFKPMGIHHRYDAHGLYKHKFAGQR